jgi:class I lanthipeptide synthase
VTAAAVAPVGGLLDTARLLRADAADAPADADFAVHLDLAVAEAEFARVLGGESAADEHWHRALAGLRAGGPVGPWLYRGAAQLGWTAHRLGRTPPAAVDDLLAGWVADYPAGAELDLPRGLLGIGVYALDHPDRAFAERVVAGTLDLVEARAGGPDGLVLRSRTAGGARLVGLAHGAAGLVAYLAAVARTGLPSAARAAALLPAALAGLLGARRPGAPGGSVYPRSVEDAAAPARSAWCHGDPGVWLALSAAAAVTDDPAVAAAAAEAAAAVLARPPGDTGVVDATVCHGAAGLLWITDRMHRATGARAAAARAEHWARTLREARARGPLTYLAPTATMERDHGFLSGDAGVALVLLAVATGTRPAWERLLLGAP